MGILSITSAAEDHFCSLLEQEGVSGMNLRISVVNPGTIKADVGISFCPPGEQQVNDIEIKYSNFRLFVEGSAIDALQDATIDYKSSELNSELVVKAPNIRGKAPDESASLYKRVEYVINTDINPGLASHGGMIRLIEITADNDVVLKFGGGCHGCGMADVTLKGGIETGLRAKFPEINKIIDATDHSLGENPYYA